jgi:hypothetical protein
MNTATQFPAPNFGYNTGPPKRKHILWKWSLATVAAGLLFLTWQCGSALYSGPKLADKAVRRFHAEFNSGEYDEICREGVEGFSQGERHAELLRFLELVHRKLGSVEAATQVNLNVKAGTEGTFLTSKYSTQFAQGRAVETFTWRKTGSILQLYGYSVQSKALLN